MGQEQGQQNPNAPCGHSSSVLWAILVAIVEFVLLANRVQARGSLLPVPLCDAPAEADGTCFVTPSPWPGAADGPGCVCIPPHPPAELSESSSLNVSPRALPVPASWQQKHCVRGSCSCNAWAPWTVGSAFPILWACPQKLFQLPSGVSTTPLGG